MGGLYTRISDVSERDDEPGPPRSGGGLRGEDTTQPSQGDLNPIGAIARFVDGLVEGFVQLERGQQDAAGPRVGLLPPGGRLPAGPLAVLIGGVGGAIVEPAGVIGPADGRGVIEGP